ncbi:MAG: nicotinamide-nucleotide adenylyltransferase [Candidatus Nanoarchaeia archaeon]|nr:nicotinamide-nucleotide adenylyltransferase [Candidatus Nanoarchaeia archaeon]MDD5238882.1 nicotinamide-nucleotide adenylyltransferase [Candidatus Nanoarchaeia archaeon]
MTTALYMGRFQPLHDGHVSAIEKALKENDLLIIGIGSVQYANTNANPFTLEERTEMIEGAVKGRYRIISVPDFRNCFEWINYIEKTAGEFNCVYTVNPVAMELFKEKGYCIKPIEFDIKISGTEIREMIAKDKNWKKFVPQSTVDVIKKAGGIERIKSIYKKGFIC